jgi:hypothetical protein
MLWTQLTKSPDDHHRLRTIIIGIGILAMMVLWQWLGRKKEKII